MGYYMDQMESDFKIKKENFSAALVAIKALAEQLEEKASGGSFGPNRIERWFSWVVTSEFVDAKTLVDAIKAWRWQAQLNSDGDISALYFEGEKLGDDEVLFDALAPFVEDGSYIQMSGEEDAMWRWVFKNGVMLESYPTISWD